ncbi:Batten's disease protein Cln3 family protein [Reticulomyxa filosa]|uniref:Batten's disease protein Cln3 family protein n=1 Tax=Reticulomyxa filosa TaxID=46433 RepID=X6P277_RETFI|nr:Batten's disease protein Cln3 family protein [Reticulomyxa filosa]|eukprot:ETO32174.1 Batten's disease protein Cln3 family protein [Reticulomyxa filosa]
MVGLKEEIEFFFFFLGGGIVFSFSHFQFALALVYFFEYVVSVGLAQIANVHESDSVQNRDYVVLALCYQAGVFISRSSISLVQFDQIGMACLTSLQGINFVLWHFHCEYNWFPQWLQFVWMIYVGLLGGAMYVNVVYSILSDTKITKKDKELCMNIMSIWVNFGIIMSSAYEIVIDNTFFAHLVQSSS